MTDDQKAPSASVAQLLREAANEIELGSDEEGALNLAHRLYDAAASLEAQEPVRFYKPMPAEMDGPDWRMIPEETYQVLKDEARLPFMTLYRHPPSSAPQDPDIGEVIDERDYWHDRATELAERVGEHFGIDVGEHTSANCPVANAIEAAWPTSVVPDGWQLVPVDLTEEMLDAWFNVPRAVRAGAAAFDPAYKAMLAAAPQQRGGEDE